MIYGITGRKQHGKSTLAAAMRAAEPTFQTLSFAGALKNVCKTVFNLTNAQMEDGILKETPFPTPIILDDYLEALSYQTQLNLEPKGLIASTPRQILQHVGTGYVRACAPTYWLDIIERHLLIPGNYLIPDTRFLNESQLIKRHLGRVVRIVDLDRAATEAVDHHPSEAEMASIVPDWTLEFHHGDFKGIEKAANWLSKWPACSASVSLSLSE